jgi:hypothetical protein
MAPAETVRIMVGWDEGGVKAIRGRIKRRSTDQVFKKIRGQKRNPTSASRTTTSHRYSRVSVSRRMLWTSLQIAHCLMHLGRQAQLVREGGGAWQAALGLRFVDGVSDSRRELRRHQARAADRRRISENLRTARSNRSWSGLR